MWLRMVHKSPRHSPDALPQTTGKTWSEWVRILNSSLPQPCGVLPVIQYLQSEYALEPVWAQMIALRYVLGLDNTGYLN
jgi:hypothetical protein